MKPRLVVRMLAAAAIFSAQTVLLAGVAHAAQSLSVGNGVLTFTSTDDVASNIKIRLEGSVYRFVDKVAFTTGAGCTAVSTTQATCSAVGITAISLSVGAGNDKVNSLAAIPTTIDGGLGDDSLFSGAGEDFLNGRDGNDRLWSRAGNDELRGEGGDDQMKGGTGDDTLMPGLGADRVDGDDPSGDDTQVRGDTVWYADRSTAVNVSLDNLANDGGAGEGDLVSTTVEHVITGPGSDILTGSAVANTLTSGPGNDTVNGGDGDDLVFVDTGDDVVNAGPGDDFVTGWDGADTLRGEDGDDSLYGSNGFDALDGGAGSDECYAEADGGSRVNCEL